MSETLREKQTRFAISFAKLILHAKKAGYDVTLGDVYRDPRVHGAMGYKVGYGAASSNHKQRLAGDINLFVVGKYVEGTEAHRELGEWWESLGDDYRWGGRFNDGNHYSIEHNGFM